MHLERLTFILEVVGQKGEATVADICAHSDLPKPSAYRLVQDLVGVGLLEPVARWQFCIGSRLKRITQSDHSDRVLLEVIAPALKQAATVHGVAFFLSRLRGTSVEIIHVETPDTGVSFLHLRRKNPEGPPLSPEVRTRQTTLQVSWRHVHRT